jgi:hypothetical protein
MLRTIPSFGPKADGVASMPCAAAAPESRAMTASEAIVRTGYFSDVTT